MSYVVADRVKETTTSTGTGSITLAGAATGFKTFSAAIGNGNSTCYVIVDSTGSQWEVGLGTLSGGTTLARTRVYSNSLGTTAAVNFSAGTKTVFVSMSAAPYNSNVSLGTAQGFYPQSYSYTTVIGYAASVSSDYATAVGQYASASANNAVAVGGNANASASRAIAIGEGASASVNNAVAVGGNANASASRAIAIGEGATASNTAVVAIGQNASSTGIGTVAIGDTASAGAGAAAGVAIGGGAAAPNSSIALGVAAIATDNNIVIGHSLIAAETGATYMNKFRIAPTTGLTGPAYALTYDSTTHEVYATSATPGGAYDWAVWQVGSTEVTGTITAPTNFTTSPSGPAYAVMAGSPQYGWGSVSPSWYIGYDGGWSWPDSEEYYRDGPGWGGLTSSWTYQTSPPSTDGLMVGYLQYPAGHALSAYTDLWGSAGGWSASYSVTSFYVSSSPPAGTTRKMYGVFVYDNGDLTGSISATPGFPSLAYTAKYSNYSNASLVVFEVTSTVDVDNILLSGATLFSWATPGNVFGHVWYEYS